MNRKAHVTCNFNYLFTNEQLFKVARSHLHCKCGNGARWSCCYYRTL